MQKIKFNEGRHLQFEMLLCLDKFCRENNITYYLAFGTLLGAARHQGFIPWDDDIDVMLPEPDLRKLCKTFQSDKYRIVSAENDKSHNLLFPRMYDMRTCSFVGNIQTFGLGIDLYGIYGLTSSVFKHLAYIQKFYKLWKQRVYLAGLRSHLIRWHLWMGKSLDCEPLHKSVLRGIAHQQQYSFMDSHICMIDTRPAMPVPKSVFGVSTKLSFEGTEFYVPQNYHQLLTLMYGDYMQLPPKEQQKPYHGYDCYWL